MYSLLADLHALVFSHSHNYDVVERKVKWTLV